MRILFLAMLAVLAFPIVADGRPKDLMKVKKIRKTLKKAYRLDDVIPIPTLRGVDISKIARSSTNEYNFINSNTIGKRGFG
jgi:hypothetical protein